MNVCLALVTLLHVFVLSSARPDGAPISACSSMEPVHSGIGVQRSEAPYTVNAENSGNRYRITISSSIGEEFEGFLLQARSKDDPDKLVDGEFTSKDSAKTIDCFNRRKSALTHADASPKIAVTTEWTPRGSVNEDVIFRATVLKTYALFWTKIDSRPLRMRSDGGITSSTEKGSDFLHIYDECFLSKDCFGLPAGCTQFGDCHVLLTFEKTEDGIHFSMHGFLEPSMYMAMGLSLDAKMGGDAVTECIRGEDDRVRARESWNEERPKVNRFIRILRRSRYVSSFRNGLASCSWTADYLFKFNNRTYDLAKKNYCLLLASGPVENGRLMYHPVRISSEGPVNLTLFGATEIIRTTLTTGTTGTPETITTTLTTGTTRTIGATETVKYTGTEGITAYSQKNAPSTLLLLSCAINIVLIMCL